METVAREMRWLHQDWASPESEPEEEEEKGVVVSLRNVLSRDPIVLSQFARGPNPQPAAANAANTSILASPSPSANSTPPSLDAVFSPHISPTFFLWAVCSSALLAVEEDKTGGAVNYDY
jgi:hypothetical protein